MDFFTIRTWRIVAACAVGLGLAACGDKSSGDSGDSEATASTSGDDRGTGTDAPTSGGSPGSGGPDGTGDTSSGELGSSSEGEGSSTTGGAVCSIEHEACALAGLPGSFEDCGVVDPWEDDAAAWQTAHDCALAAASEQRAFKLITVLQGIDSEVAVAFVGQEGRSYALSVLSFDGDPCGGGGCGPVVALASCAGLTAAPGCTIEPGTACLSCEGQGTSVQVCGPP